MTRAGIDACNARGEPDNSDRSMVFDRRTGAELSGVVVAPTLHRTCIRQRACVLDARGDLGDARAETGHVDGHVALGCGAVTELAMVVAAPTLDGSRDGERARMVVSSRDHSRIGLQTDDVDRPGPFNRGAVT